MEKLAITSENGTAFDPIIPASPAKTRVAREKAIFWLKLIGINLLIFGLELCACAGFAYIPPILLKNDFSYKNLNVIMAVGPFISFFIVPAIGRWSDKCQSRFGRRRPFIFVLGVLMIFSLLVIPYSSDLILYHKFVLALGVIILDFSSQALMNPCKALIPDIFHSSEDQTSGFTVYSCMMSFGGCVGYFISSFDWSTTTLGIFFGGQEKAIFCFLTVILVFILGLTLIVAKEKPLQRNIYLTSELNSEASINVISPAPYEESPLSTPTNGFVVNHPSQNSHETRRFLFQCLKVRSSLRFIQSLFQKLVLLMLLPIIVIKYNLQELIKMPKIVRNLFMACLLGWMGIMCHDMYYSDFVGQVIYQGKPHAERQSNEMSLYDEGVRMGSWGLLFHSLSSTLYAGIQHKLMSHFGMRKVYIFGMFSFTLSMVGTILTKNLIGINIFAAISGLGLAAITTIPYTLITEYSKRRELKSYFEKNYRGVGEDMAVLDSAFYLAQIIPSFFLGYVIEYTKSSSTYMYAAAICGIAACIVAYFISYTTKSKNVY